MLVQLRMVALEEKNRDLSSKSKVGNVTNNNEDLSDMDMMPVNMDLQYKLQEVQRVNQILSKSRDVQTKTLSQLKAKMESLAEKYKGQIDSLQNQLTEKMKEIRLYQIKLKQKGGENIAALYQPGESSEIDFERHTQEERVIQQNLEMAIAGKIKVKAMMGGIAGKISLDVNKMLRKQPLGNSPLNYKNNPSISVLDYNDSPLLNKQPMLDDDIRSLHQREEIALKQSLLI